MKIKADDLQKHLKPLKAVYFVSGDEPLLLQEACDQIRASAKKQGFEEREIFTVGTGFDWHHFFDASDNLSLFSSRKLLELRFNQKPNKAAQEAINRYLENPGPDNVLLITSPKVDASSQKTKWYKNIDTSGITLPIWPLSRAQLPYWIKQRFEKAGFKPSKDAVNTLCGRTEGNLLAASQEIEKMTLLFEPGNISAEQVMKASSDHFRYDTFALVDCCLEARTKSINKILVSLKDEGVEPTLILWAMTRELRTLLSIAENVAAGDSIESTLNQFRVWEKRKPLYRAFIQRSTKADIYKCFQLAHNIDKSIKGLSKENCWEHLLMLSLDIAGSGQANDALKHAVNTSM